MSSQSGTSLVPWLGFIVGFGAAMICGIAWGDSLASDSIAALVVLAFPAGIVGLVTAGIFAAFATPQKASHPPDENHR